MNPLRWERCSGDFGIFEGDEFTPNVTARIEISEDDSLVFPTKWTRSIYDVFCIYVPNPQETNKLKNMNYLAGCESNQFWFLREEYAAMNMCCMCSLTETAK